MVNMMEDKQNADEYEVYGLILLGTSVPATVMLSYFCYLCLSAYGIGGIVLIACMSIAVCVIAMVYLLCGAAIIEFIAYVFTKRSQKKKSYDDFISQLRNDKNGKPERPATIPDSEKAFSRGIFHEG